MRAAFAFHASRMTIRKIAAPAQGSTGSSQSLRFRRPDGALGHVLRALGGLDGRRNDGGRDTSHADDAGGDLPVRRLDDARTLRMSLLPARPRRHAASRVCSASARTVSTSGLSGRPLSARNASTAARVRAPIAAIDIADLVIAEILQLLLDDLDLGTLRRVGGERTADRRGSADFE